ncbi:xanthine dehydrogenase family protein subunit M [Mesorhizobium sp. LHD-90]|uniref:FAD binding domain-containing protein n=1 Tax=Mesorhizobium sp. LHD-90 TaxID=3071414 RepID=UPI0027E02022|nr:xanthine dehydrogenase family protein subunit M [Mesorhizobium sp. LHD-90]MDQ6433223.1 xanthine dehydrogenase family protein subunit M [Mesorhizobium sp. LHD-90]
MPLNFHRPSSLREAMDLKQDLGEACHFLAGGTDLMIQRNRGRKIVGAVVDLSRLRGLDRIEPLGDGLRIGALARMRALETDERVRILAPALAEAARVVGGAQVRHMATLGGNIANASPAADTVPVLLALAAFVVVLGPNGERRVPIAELLAGRGRTTLQAAEIITHVELPRPARGSAFLKAGRRKAMEIAVVNAAVSLELDAKGLIHAARLALGAVADRSLVVADAEAMMRGQAPSPELFKAAATLARDASRPISDVRASADYRRHLASVLTERALTLAHKRLVAATTGIPA